MNLKAQEYYARKFFPHLRLDYALLCVQAVLRSRGLLSTLVAGLSTLLGVQAFGAAFIAPPVPSAGQNVTVVPAGLTGAGISNLVRTLPSTNVTLRFQAGVYNVPPVEHTLVAETNAAICFRNKTNWVVEGEGDTTVFFSSGDGQVIGIADCKNFTLRNIAFDSDMVGHSSNGIPHITYHTACFRTNDGLLFENIKYSDIHVHCLGLYTTSSDRNDNVMVRGVTGFNYGCTNIVSFGIDGSLIAGAANNLTITDFRCTEGMRGIEMFSTVGGQAFTNITIANGSIESFGYDGVILTGPLVGIKVSNVGLSERADIWTLPGANTAVFMADGVSGVTIDNVSVAGTTGIGFGLQASTGGLSNITFMGCHVINCGASGLGGGGFVLNDASGDGVIDGVRIIGCTVNGTRAGGGVDMNGGRNVYILDSAFVDIGEDSLRNGILLSATGDITTNVAVIGNRFQNYGTASTKMQNAISVAAGAMAVRFENNFVTNMAVGAVLDSGGSTTVVGERFSYSAVLDIPSIPVNQSRTTNFTASLARTNWYSQLMVPAQFWAAAGSTNAVITSWCSNGVVYVRVANNDAITAFDPPSVRYRALIQAMEAY